MKNVKTFNDEVSVKIKELRTVNNELLIQGRSNKYIANCNYLKGIQYVMDKLKHHKILGDKKNG